jgi:hydroxymethylbilane synthase
MAASDNPSTSGNPAAGGAAAGGNPAQTLRIATRESRLALWQAEHVQALLRERFGVPVELLGMTTRGDQILDRALSKVGGKGLFVKELETALEEGRAELAVHSLKDVPMDLPEGFVLAAVLEREDPRDAFVSNRFDSLDALPEGAVVGTSSLRRVVQLRNARPDLVVEPLRGNLDTRLRKLDEGGYDAIVLAAAGLKRLGLASRIRSAFETTQMLPCAGQGALGIEIRVGDALLAERLASLVHLPTSLAVQAERAVSRALGGSCSMPLAAHAQWDGDELWLRVALGHPERTESALLRHESRAQVQTEAAARALGEAAAQALRDAGAADYLGH